MRIFASWAVNCCTVQVVIGLFIRVLIAGGLIGGRRGELLVVAQCLGAHVKRW